MLYLLITFLIIFLFLYLTIYVDVIFLFGFTGAIIIFFCILARIYFVKLANLLANDNKMFIGKETADDHPIIKSARSRLEK